MSDYVATYSGSVVETEDFKRCFEKESGLNLTKFFDQWVYGKGYPKLKVTYEDLVDSREIVQIVIEQTQGSKTNDIPEVCKYEHQYIFNL